MFLAMIEGIQYCSRLSKMTIWPSPVTTDHDGRFTIRGVNRDQGMISANPR